jgi:uncharacterized membrane protein YgcG
MRRLTTIAAIALSLGLAACGGGTTAADETEATETTETEATRPDAFFIDEAGFVDEGEIGPVSERLGTLFDETGKIALVVAIRTTEDQDIEEAANAMLAERGADALILIAGEDEALAIVGEGIDPEEAALAEQAMIDGFDNGDLAGGFAAGVDFLVAQLGAAGDAVSEEAPEAAAEPVAE